MTKHLCVKIWLIVSVIGYLDVSIAVETANAMPPAATNAARSEVLQVSNEKIHDAFSSVTARLSAVEEAVIKASDKAAQDRARTAWITFATVVVSGIIGFGVQLFVMGRQRVMNQDQAQAEVSNSYVEWQLKQLCELYGPLRALLGQSNAMYRLMNRALAAAAPEKFRLTSKAGEDFDNAVFEILHDGQWIHFRTVRHLGEVYNKGYGVEPYFDDVVTVGSRIASLIRDKAGYAQSSDQLLIDVMGAYLAHYEVLSRLHMQAKSGMPQSYNKADEEATFPIAIQKLVNTGFNTINSEVMNWKSNGRASVKA